MVIPFTNQRKALGIVYGEEETDWFQLEMWNRDAEYAAKVCKKGGRVGVTVSCCFCFLLRMRVIVVVLLIFLLLFGGGIAVVVLTWPVVVRAWVVVVPLL